MADKPFSDRVKNLGYVPTPTVEGEWTVDKVLSAGSDGPELTAGTESPVPFFHLLERLKTTKREGWRRFGVERGESIADHMFRMSIITLLTPPSLAARLDLPRCTKMCLIHDMAESLVGDITPVDGVPKAEKSRRETETVSFISESLLGNVYGGVPGKELQEIWQEYEDGETLEARYVHDVDKMELLLQMFEYEKRSRGEANLSEFVYVSTKIELPEVKAWAAELLAERARFWKGQGGEVRGVKGSVAVGPKAQQDEYYSRKK
ncbi:related to HD family hydrolase [Cephalotrichum gorgonifer]|uniref:5'-deoxynucleotidase n=1 Tax=Cephalotrichum gorgonifer TaxID=2041049 RepID=A0AAE8MQX1_9PEZI|nr:related to HD family hydrolase [Cephalotrichum gorgonifer]